MNIHNNLIVYEDINLLKCLICKEKFYYNHRCDHIVKCTECSKKTCRKLCYNYNITYCIECLIKDFYIKKVVDDTDFYLKQINDMGSVFKTEFTKTISENFCKYNLYMKLFPKQPKIKKANNIVVHSDKKNCNILMNGFDYLKDKNKFDKELLAKINLLEKRYCNLKYIVINSIISNRIWIPTYYPDALLI